MAKKDDENIIRITHYINPHMFWFKYESSFFDTTKLFELENKIQNYVASEDRMRVKKFEPQVDQMVAVFHVSWDRWIRAKVDDIVTFTLGAPKYILWLIDYGVPLQSNYRWIRELPAEIANQIESVHFGGINNIVPAQKRYDLMKGSAVIEVCEKWSPKAVIMMEDLINDAAMIKFTPEMYTIQGQYFGNLEITTHTSTIIKANILLLNKIQATTIDEFSKVIRNLGTNKIPRWKTNEGNTLVFKYHSNKISTEKMLYDSKTYRKREPPNFGTSEYGLQLEKKIGDWEQRNQRLQHGEDVTMHDISFHDSTSVSVGISVAKPAEKIIVESDGKEEEKVAKRVAATRRILERYRQVVLKRPRGNNAMQTAPAAKEDKTSHPVETSRVLNLYQSSSSDNNGMNQLCDSMAKTMISRENNSRNKENKPPQNQVDEVW